MTARAFLVRGLLAGLIAGFVAFGVAYVVGEPPSRRAIALEEASAAADPHEALARRRRRHAHAHGEEGTVVSRAHQRTWGLLTGSLVVGVALGGLVGLVAAVGVGRFGRLGAGPVDGAGRRDRASSPSRWCRS